jgi:hypothetical protein
VDTAKGEEESESESVKSGETKIARHFFPIQKDNNNNNNNNSKSSRSGRKRTRNNARRRLVRSVVRSPPLEEASSLLAVYLGKDTRTSARSSARRSVAFG